ncbi:hypothetical protein ACMAY8_14490 [Rhodobacteraceae bacterium nBUS_22]
MTTSGRRGHLRTNASGTTFWVKEHTVERINYTISKQGTTNFVNGKRLLGTTCKFCYQKVFYIWNDNRDQVFFNTKLDPLTQHKCQKAPEHKTFKAPLAITKKYLSENDAKALDRRAAEIRQRLEEETARKLIKGNQDRALSDLIHYLTANEYSFNQLKFNLMKSFFFALYPAIIKDMENDVFRLKDEYPDVPLSLKAFNKRIRPATRLCKNLKTLTTTKKNIKNYVGKKHASVLRQAISKLQNSLTEAASVHSNRVAHYEKEKRRKQLERKQSQKSQNAIVGSKGQRKKALAAAKNVQIEVRKGKKRIQDKSQNKILIKKAP